MSIRKRIVILIRLISKLADLSQVQKRVSIIRNLESNLISSKILKFDRKAIGKNYRLHLREGNFIRGFGNTTLYRSI